MASLPITSIGATISVAIEETAGVRPISGYKKVPQVTEFPEIDITPDTIETTSFDNQKYKSSTYGLIDATGMQTMKANYTDDLVDMWNEFCEAAATAAISDKMAWICLDVPKAEEALYIPIIPVPLGAFNIVVNDRIQQNVNFTIAGDFVHEVAPTYYAATTYSVTVSIAAENNGRVLMLYRVVSSSEMKLVAKISGSTVILSSGDDANVFAGMIVGKYVAVYVGTGDDSDYELIGTGTITNADITIALGE